MKSNIEIPVVFSTDENYVPYLSIAIQSVMMNADLGKRYHIYVLHANTIAETSIAKLKAQVAAFSQFSIDFVDVSDFMKDKNLFISWWTIEVYFRLLIPYIFTEYEKVLYLDCDIICKADIAEIYETELDDYLLAATKDKNMINNWLKPSYIDKSKPHLYGISFLKNPENYFNAGVLLFNVKEFRNFISLEKLLELAASRKWLFADQDLLNVVCENRVKYISTVWNFFNTNESPAYAPKNIKKDFEMAQKNPKIIHFVKKPLTNPDIDIKWRILFFEYAQYTAFCDHIIVTMHNNGILEPIVRGDRLKKRIFENIQSKRIGMRFIAQCFYFWLKSRL